MKVQFVSGSPSKVYDGTPLTCDDFTVKADAATPGYGFVKEEGVASVTMTPASTVTNPGSVPNVIASETAKEGTKLDRNYVVTTEPGTLTVTAATMGIEAFDAEKFYDAEPTNVTWAVTNATGAAITDAAISLREKGTDAWIPVADFVPYVDATNVTVEVRAEKTGFTPVTAEATVLVKPRPVTLVAASDAKAYDGLPLTNWNFTVKADAATPGYGFVKDEGVASVTMTDGSTVTDPGSVPNEIASETAKDGTKLGRNYVVTTEPGTLTVTAAAFTASAELVEKFYDSVPTNIVVTVSGVPAGVTPAYEYSYSEAEGYVPAADFTGPTNVSETAVVWCRVIIPGTTNTVHATATIKPRIVVHHAKNASKNYDGTPLRQPDYYEDSDVETEKSKAKWGTDEALPNSIGFVDGEGFAADLVMTADSQQTLVGEHANVIDQVAEKTVLKPNTKPENYEIYYLPGSLIVVDADPYVGEYDAKEHSIKVNVPEIPGVDSSDVTVTYSWDFGGPYTSLEALLRTDVVTGKRVYYKVEVPGYPDVYGSSTIDITPIPVHIVSNDDFKYFDGEPLTNWTGVATITTNGVTTTFDVGTEVPLVGDDKIVISYTGTQTEVGNSPNSFGYTFVNPEKAKNYIITTEEGELEVIQREEEVQRDEDFEELPEETKEAIKEADKKVNEILEKFTEADQENSGEPFVKYQLTVTKKDDLTERDRTVPAVADVDAEEQVKEIVKAMGKTPDVSEYVDVILERTYDKDESTKRAEKGKDGYNKEKWDQLDEAKDHNDIILSVMFPYEVPDGMELLGVTRSCHPDNNYDPEDATHGLLTAVPKVPEGQQPTQEGFYYDPEKKTITLYAKDFCLFGFHLRAIPPPPPPPPPPSSCEEITCAWAYRVKLAGKTVKGRLLTGKTSCDVSTCWAKQASFRVAGYVYGVGDGTGSACNPCSYNDWTEGSGAKCHYWDENKRQVFADETTFSFDLFEVLRNSGAKNKVQVAWTLGGLRLAGFGVYNPETQMLKTANGFFAGYLGPAVCADKCDKDKNKVSLVFDPCDMKTPRESERTIVFGRWSISYQSDKVRQIEKCGTWDCLYPSGWQPAKEK